MKFETARIHFLGDDLAAVAVVVNVLTILFKSNTQGTFLKLFKTLKARVLNITQNNCRTDREQHA